MENASRSLGLKYLLCKHQYKNSVRPKLVLLHNTAVLQYRTRISSPTSCSVPGNFGLSFISFSKMLQAVERQTSL